MTTRRLFWDPPPDTDLVGFDVFRAPATGDNMLLDDIIAGNVQPGTVVTRVTLSLPWTRQASTVLRTNTPTGLLSLWTQWIYLQALAREAG